MGLRHECFSREVENSVNLKIEKDASEFRSITNITFNQRRVTDELPVAGGKIVENNRLKACDFQGLYGMAANVAGSARNEHHSTFFLKYSIVSCSP